MTDTPVRSPCVGRCALDPRTVLCLGCARTVDEIAAWGFMDDAARRRVLRSLAARQAAGTAAAPDLPPIELAPS